MFKLIAITLVLVLGFQYFQKNYVLEATWKGEPIFTTDQGIISNQGSNQAKKSFAKQFSEDDSFAEFR